MRVASVFVCQKMPSYLAIALSIKTTNNCEGSIARSQSKYMQLEFTNLAPASRTLYHALAELFRWGRLNQSALASHFRQRSLINQRLTKPDKWQWINALASRQLRAFKRAAIDLHHCARVCRD